MQSAKPSMDYGLKGLMPIQERDEARSADPAKDTYTRHKNAQYYQYKMRNQAKGYQGEKENGKLPKISDGRSYLQNRGAAIMSGAGAGVGAAG